jgi:hypothetical protein
MIFYIVSLLNYVEIKNQIDRMISFDNNFSSNILLYDYLKLKTIMNQKNLFNLTKRKQKFIVRKHIILLFLNSFFNKFFTVSL